MNQPAQLAIALTVAAVAAYLMAQAMEDAQAAQEAAPPDLPWFDPWGSLETGISDMQKAITNDKTAAGNERAFLAVIRHAEGTSAADGYSIRFGGARFSGFADHPRVATQFTDGAGRRLWTSAAGAYQFMAVSPIPGGGSTKVNTWDRIKAKLGLRDFSPASQDAAALELIREAGALPDVRDGRFADAIAKVKGIWASLPGAGYAQPEKSLATLASVFVRSGGVMA